MARFIIPMFGVVISIVVLNPLVGSAVNRVPIMSYMREWRSMPILILMMARLVEGVGDKAVNAEARATLCDGKSLYIVTNLGQLPFMLFTQMA